MKTHFKLAALLIVALLFSAAQCAASCAFASCDSSGAASSVPPCHRHGHPASHQSPAPCGHEHNLLGPDGSSISQGSVSGPLVAAAPAPAILESLPDVIAEALHVPIPSPPQLRTASLLVLRI